MSYTFVLRGKEYKLDRRDLEQRLRGVTPRPSGKYGFRVGFRVFPAKQALSVALNLEPSGFSTQDAVRILSKIGLPSAGAERVPETLSEQKFDRYMAGLGLGLEREPKIDGTAKRIDFRIPHSGCDVLFEVKEWVPKILEEGSAGAFDATLPVRRKIAAAEQQLGGLHAYCRCLVLYNCGRPLVGTTVSAVFAAVAGDPRTMPALPSADSRSQPGSGLDALVVIEEMEVGMRRFEIAVSRREKESGKIALADYFEELERAHGTELDTSLTVIRAVAHEHPRAVHPLPVDLFRGPYDERYRLNNRQEIERIYAGNSLKTIEAQEWELGMNRNQLKRLLAGDRPRRDYHPVEVPGEPVSEIILRERR